MNGFAQFWGDLLPLRWYIEILFDQAVRGLPASVSVQPFAVLGGLAVGLSALAWLRLRSIAPEIETYHAPAAPPVAYAPPPRGVGASLVAELRLVVTDSGVFGLIVLAPLIYGLLYPQPYLGQLLRELPIAVVDQDHTELSREFDSEPQRRRSFESGRRTRVPGRCAGGAGSQTDIRGRRHSRGDGARHVEGRSRPHSGLCRLGVFSVVQPRSRGNIRRGPGRGAGDRHARGAPGRQSRARRVDPEFSRRAFERAALQSDRRLRQLCRAGRVHSDPATDAVHGRGDARGRGVRDGAAARPSGAARASARCSARRSRISV